MMRVCFLLLVAAFLAAPGYFGQAMADQARVGVTLPTNPFPPYYVMPSAPGNPVTGQTVDVIRTIVETYNSRHAQGQEPVLDLTVLPNLAFSRCLKMLQTGEAQIIGALYYNEERAGYMHLIPYDDGSFTGFVLRKDGTAVDSYEDLARLRVGHQQNYWYFKKFNTDDSLNKHASYTLEELLNLLEHGRIDAVALNVRRIEALFAEDPSASERFVRAGYVGGMGAPVHIGLSKAGALGREPYLGRLTAIIGELRDNGTIKAVIQAYHDRARPASAQP